MEQRKPVNLLICKAFSLPTLSQNWSKKMVSEEKLGKLKNSTVFKAIHV